MLTLKSTRAFLKDKDSDFKRINQNRHTTPPEKAAQFAKLGPSAGDLNPFSPPELEIFSIIS
jgi:hypothetical protein